MRKAIIATYDFDMDAMGLGDFVSNEMSKLTDDEIVVYVTDQDGRAARKAIFERETLTDGSTTVNLVIEFDEPNKSPLT